MEKNWKIIQDQEEVVDKAGETYREAFGKKSWYGRCIFLSWYCGRGDCKFCYRSTIQHKKRFRDKARRSTESIIVEALIAKAMNWELEFLTGGHDCLPFEDIEEISRIIKDVFQEKIWVNLGALSKEKLKKLSSYVKGVVGSVETTNKELHDEVCPSKGIKEYEEMFRNAQELNMKRSMTIVIGLGEEKEDIKKMFNFIEKHSLERITFYALKPVKGTPYEKGPDTDYYTWWLANTRINFPQLTIIGGTTARRVEEVDKLLEAGVNAVTKFPASKKVGTEDAKLFAQKYRDAGRECEGRFYSYPEKDWDEEIEKIDISEELKKKVKKKLEDYIGRTI